jgi:hypothetical protein
MATAQARRSGSPQAALEAAKPGNPPVGEPAVVGIEFSESYTNSFD